MATREMTLPDTELEQIDAPFVVFTADDLPTVNDRPILRAPGVSRPIPDLPMKRDSLVMGITCPCCGMRFIVCAVHLTPDGRTVMCLNCDTRWPMPAEGTVAPRPVASRPAAASLAGAAGRWR